VEVAAGCLYVIGGNLSSFVVSAGPQWHEDQGGSNDPSWFGHKDYPPDPGPWREPQCREFNQAVHQAIRRLREELRPAWQIHDEFQDLHEDPDLDRYLTDTQAFTRNTD